jgi:mannose-6-phosphate isomerase-like protein (cupin superfamily)
MRLEAFMDIARLSTATLVLAALLPFSTTQAWAFDPIVSIGGQRPAIHPNGGHQEILATKEQTDGKFGMTTTSDPAGSGPGGTMAHTKEAEMWYVLEGTYEFQVGGKTFEGGPGTFVAVDAGQSHTFLTKTAGTLLMFWMPGGFEQFFVDWDKAGIKPGPELGKLEQTYGVTRP